MIELIISGEIDSNEDEDRVPEQVRHSIHYEGILNKKHLDYRRP